MGRDLPDWGALPSPLTVHELTDLGELAARLGSVVTYHRGGIVTFIETFEDGLKKWTTDLTGSGDAVDLSITRSKAGLFAARLVAGHAVTPFAEIAHTLPKQVQTRTGIEFAFSGDTNTTFVELDVAVYDGTDTLTGNVRYGWVAKTLEYLDSGGSYVSLATGLDLLPEEEVFHSFKLVLDPENENYIKVLLDDVAYSLSNIGLRKVSGSNVASTVLSIRNRGVVGDVITVYVDHVITTQNEPL